MNVPACSCNRNGMAEGTRLVTVVEEHDDGDCIALNESRKCPLLNERKLCDVVLTYGEENISTTCHTFPRESHEYDNYVEKTLAMGCPAALDLLWAEDEFWCVESLDDSEIDKQSIVDEDETSTYEVSDIEELVEFRDALMELVDYDLSVEKALKILFYIGLDCLDMQDTFIDGELLLELAQKIEEIIPDLESTYNEQNELFLDLCDNYRKKGIYKNVIDELAHLAEKYEDEMSDNLLNDREEFERLFERKLIECSSDSKAYSGKLLSDMLRNLVLEEIYSTMLLPEGDLYSMVMKLQWIAITYAVIKQCMFLRWKIRGQLTYEDIREIVVVVIRMTGYSEADIEEYLENSFEEVIWDWGYMALILG